MKNKMGKKVNCDAVENRNSLECSCRNSFPNVFLPLDVECIDCIACFEIIMNSIVVNFRGMCVFG